MNSFTIQKSSITTLLLFAMLSNVLSSCNTEKPIPVYPSGGITISNNTPTLSWTAVECDFYTVVMNDLIIDTVTAGQNFMVPFPLSFGQHQWKVIAHTGNISMKSETASFVIDDEPLNPIPEGALLLRQNWKVQSSLLIDAGGEQLSNEMFDESDWYTTSVPATVLTALVRNGVYPNPYVDMNNMKIPDSNDEYNETYDLIKYSHIEGVNPWQNHYWYRTEFELPENFLEKEVWLNFSEINYRAEVWLNGALLADTATMVGMERSFRFNITHLLQSDATNYLAVAIYPVDVPGKPEIEPLTPLGMPGENMGDGMISKNYTKWDALGWDWQPAIRDRNMGISEDVFLSTTNTIEIQNLYIGTTLPLPDTSYANVDISAELVNHSNTKQKGEIRATISTENETFRFVQIFEIAPGERHSFYWNAENRAVLRIDNPKLWWPHGYGNPNLYQLKVEATVNDETMCVSKTNFGIRQADTYIGKNERVIKINGKDIYIKGGNWVLDMMLNWNSTRYEEEIVLSKNANLNLLRVWGPTGVPPRAFYEAADKHGMLIWQDFLNDYWGTFRNTPGYSPDDNLYKAATTGIVKKLRNYPSLIIWCGGNEGLNPREEMITTEILPKYDHLDSRFYLRASDNDGLHGGGPYNTISPDEYFVHPKMNGFSSEIGPSGLPVLESVMKFMPRLGKSFMPDRFPIDSVWAYHDANDWPDSDPRKFSTYDNLIRQQYGVPKQTNNEGIAEYFSKAQFLNYDVYRAAIEAFNNQLWENSSGILLWKSNSSWPSMVWQLYDWYQQAHAGYYGAKKGSGFVHIQLNRNSNQVVALNVTHSIIENINVDATLYNSTLEKLWQKEMVADLAENTITPTNWTVPVTEALCFLKLTLNDHAGNIIADNFYWLSSTNKLTELDSLKEAVVETKVKHTSKNGKEKFTITICNTGSTLALMTVCKLTDEATGVEVLPSIWSNNYITLLPGESEALELEVNSNQLTNNPVIEVTAYNMPKMVVKAEK